jgi:hypothetical protein
MAKRRVSKAKVNKEMTYDLLEDEDELDSLLDGEEDEEAPLLDEEEEDTEADEAAPEMKGLYKALAERDALIVDLAKAVRTLAKRVMAMEKRVPTSDFRVGGSEDLGTPEAYSGGTPQEPGLTPGEPQGLAKDDKWSNFGEKDSTVPGNAPVTPDTKDWPADQTVVDGRGGGLSGMAPHGVRGINKSVEELNAKVALLEKALEAAGIVVKALPTTIGAPDAQGQQITLEDAFEKARSLSFRELNRLREQMGEL